MIRFVDAFEVDKSIIVVTELLAGGELFERSVHNQPQLHLKPTFCQVHRRGGGANRAGLLQLYASGLYVSVHRCSHLTTKETYQKLRCRCISIKMVEKVSLPSTSLRLVGIFHMHSSTFCGHQTNLAKV